MINQWTLLSNRSHSKSLKNKSPQSLWLQLRLHLLLQKCRKKSLRNLKLLLLLPLRMNNQSQRARLIRAGLIKVTQPLKFNCLAKLLHQLKQLSQWKPILKLRNRKKKTNQLLRKSIHHGWTKKLFPNQRQWSLRKNLQVVWQLDLPLNKQHKKKKPRKKEKSKLSQSHNPLRSKLILKANRIKLHSRIR